MRLLKSILAADIALGKVNKLSLPQETFMELLIEGIENKSEICLHFEGNPEIFEWNGVKFGGEREVAEIDWSESRLQGTIDLQWLPLTIARFYVFLNHLRGSINLNCVPDTLLEIDMSENRFSGEVSLVNLPPNLLIISVADNRLCGSLDLDQLPASLTELYLGMNNFSGSVSLKNLPVHMQILDLYGNSLEGTYHPSDLPEGLRNQSALLDGNYLVHD